MAHEQRLWETTFPEYVPKIEPAIVEAMRAQITPALLDPEKHWLHRIKGIDEINAYNQSFIWDGETEGEPMSWSPLDHLKIPSLHTFAASANFKPTLAECYAAIRRFLPDYSQVRWMAIEIPNRGQPAMFDTNHLAHLHLFGDSVATQQEWQERQRLRVAQQAASAAVILRPATTDEQYMKQNKEAIINLMTHGGLAAIGIPTDPADLP